MIDFNLTLRDSLGNLTFGITSDSVSGMELLLQKITIALLSDSQNNPYQSFTGGNLKQVGILTIDPTNINDLKSLLSTNISAIESNFKKIDLSRTAPLNEKLDTLSLLDVIVDANTLNVSISLYVKNLAGQSTSLDIPVRTN